MRSAISLLKNRPGSSTNVVHRRCRLAENTEPIDRVGINCLRGYHNQKPSGRTIIVQKGRVVFGAMDEVVFGQPAAEAVAGQIDRLHLSRAFLMVSGTLNRNTDEIEKVRQSLGRRYAGSFDAMPPHTPREAVVAAAEQARAAGADIIITIGGGSITDGAKAVQLCLANDVRTVEDIDRIRAVKGAVPVMNPPEVRQISVPTTIAGGEFSGV